MKGLDLSKIAFNKFKDEILNNKYSMNISKMAFGLVGEGSECFGFDDEYSIDHDYGVGFCIWLNKHDYLEFGQLLQNDYDEFILNQDNSIKKIETQYSYKKVGVFEITEFYRKILNNDIPKTDNDFRYIDMPKLANCTNGEVFFDDFGEFSSVRNHLISYPKDIRIKKIAKSIALASQAGQYNYYRMKKRDDIIACNLAVNIFISNIIEVIYLLNNVHMPFYKWAGYGITKLEKLSYLRKSISGMYSNINSFDFVSSLIEYISSEIIVELKRQNLTDLDDDFLFNHSVSVHSKINDEYLRYTNIMED